MTIVLKCMVDLQQILKKDPVLATATAEELAHATENVETNYRRHAMTHMSLGDTTAYEEKLFRLLTSNSRTFAGMVTGDYGLGKTSLLVYLWYISEKRRVVAVPPFSWRNIDDIFVGIEAWITFQLLKTNQEAGREFQKLCLKFKKKTKEKEVQELVHMGIERSHALQRVEEKVESGVLRLDRSVSELLQFCDASSQLLKEYSYEGLLIFLDELQLTVTELSPAKAFQYIFELANSTMNRKGNYGFMIGVPLNTYVQMKDIRSDALDRFAHQGMLIDLSKVYTQNFAVNLWHKYADYFGFTHEQPDILDPLALVALGQITDSSRKDLGNGPRSVISAFKAIIGHYYSTGKSYTVFELIKDCLNDTILLGVNSKLVKQLLELEKKVEEDPEYRRFIQVLAAFPQGCKRDFLIELGVLNTRTELLLKEWLGLEIRQNITGSYTLSRLDVGQVVEQSFIERFIRDFVRHYEFNNQDRRRRAYTSFLDHIVPEILTDKGKPMWQCLFEQHSDQAIEFRGHGDMIFSNDIGGTYDRLKTRYPSRHLRIIVTGTLTKEPFVPPRNIYDDEFVYVGDWLFYLDFSGKGQMGIKLLETQKQGEYTIKCDLNMKRKLSVDLPVIQKNVLNEMLDIQFLLDLVHSLKISKSIPASEAAEVEFVAQKIISDLIVALFPIELKQIQGVTWSCSLHGKLLFCDIFEQMCKDRFPKYRTLKQGVHWEINKMKYISLALNKEGLALSIKRGTKPLALNYSRSTAADKKSLTTNYFGINSTSTFENLVTEYSDLLEIDKKGQLFLKVHPAEQLCLERIRNSNLTLVANGVSCPAIELSSINQELQTLGYTKAERIWVFKLASLRKLFFLDELKNLLYIHPLTLEEWQTTLNQQYLWLKSAYELEQLFQIPMKVQLDNFENQINNLKNDEHYEGIALAIRQEQQRLQQLIYKHYSNKQSQIISDIDNVGARITTLNQELLEVDIPLDLQACGWARHKTTLCTLISKCQALYGDLISLRQSQVPLQFVELSGETFSEIYQRHMEFIEGLYQKTEELRQKLKVIQLNIQSWKGWKKYFQTREEILQLIQRLSTIGISNLLVQLKQLDQQIEDAWQSQIPEAKDWLARLTEVQHKIEQAVQQSRDCFEKEKYDYQDILSKIGSKQLLRQTFQETDQMRSCDLLRTEFKEYIINEIEEWLEDAANLERRLYYLHNILSMETRVFDTQVQSIIKQLFKLKGKIQQQCDVKTTSECRPIFDQIADCRKRLSFFTEKGKLTKEEELLKTCIQGRSSTLEELILNYVGKTDKANLDDILKLTTNLFRKNHINVRIEREGI